MMLTIKASGPTATIFQAVTSIWLSDFVHNVSRDEAWPETN